jgi:fibro-slime domain-containing protein
MLEPSGPACGDAEINQAEEECDDGNSLPGDGCSGKCLVERYWECPEEGKPCQLTFACGDGAIDPGEVCDDANTDDDDGCSASCTQQDPAYVCKEGEPCTKIHECGDGRVNLGEQCEDGGKPPVDGDGCDASCKKEAGYQCPKVGQKCTVITFCGDGAVQAGESCDDRGGMNPPGNDGCSTTCKVEADYSCPSTGGACTYLPKCGDGVISGAEVCDDGGGANPKSNDGCSADCKTIEDGWACPREGRPCRTICGDGKKLGKEQCDDGDTDDNDGCSSLCKIEPGKMCTDTVPQDCSGNAVCGNGKPEGNEPCDDGNKDWRDGCTPDCKAEPTCTTGACTSVCGDGILLPNAGPTECDDGNKVSGDGCDASCKIELGYTCSVEPTSMVLPMVIRDFIGWCPTGPYNSSANNAACDNDLTDTLVGHPDFEIDPGLGNQVDGTVATQLDGEGKPVNNYANTNTATVATGWTTGVENFKSWYRDDARYNKTLLTFATLVETAAGSGTFVYERNPFWPVDVTPTPATDPKLASLVVDPDGAGPLIAKEKTQSAGHNFYFTSELRYWFQYQPNAATPDPVLTFYGDDDVWVFIKNTLTADIGGIHGQNQESVVIKDDGDATVNRFDGGTTNIDLNLVAGSIYEIVVFQAERHVTGSNYQLTLQGFSAGKSVCEPSCGDGVVTADEECDDGANNKPNPGYGQCKTVTCTLGDYCGDGTTQAAGNEECDNGTNTSSYGDTAANACAPGCVKPPQCGDNKVNPPSEECDLGVNNTVDGYGGCTKQCQAGGYCGDGIENGTETCDDGVNDGIYGGCTADCKPAAQCDDGVLQSEWGEICDDAIPADAAKGCQNCTFADCGNELTEPEKDEQCDDGVNDGGYNECGPMCKLGPYCGDGVVQSDFEQCDDGEENNLGKYGECAPGCVYGPYCGDGKVQKPYEDCDDKNKKSGDGCSPACKKEVNVPK